MAGAGLKRGGWRAQPWSGFGGEEPFIEDWVDVERIIIRPTGKLDWK